MNAEGAPASKDRGAELTRRLSRDILVVSFALFFLLALTWVDLIRRAGFLTPTTVGRHLMMPDAVPYGAGDLAMIALMWIVMMVAMMVPSAVPMVLLYTRFTQRRRASGRAAGPTGAFLVGYLLVWTGFSLLATGAQWGLHTLALLSPDVSLLNTKMAGAVLLAAGTYQFSRLKRTCLVHCQSPLDFLGAHWREGAGGAIRMGLAHGVYCLGCCWALMLLLFVGGVMNLAWIAVLALFVLIERVVANGLLVSRVAGAVFLLWGLGLLTGVLAR